MSNAQQEFVNNFSHVVSEVLYKNLDGEIFEKIGFSLKSSSPIREIESLKNNNALYKIEYATGSRLGNLMLLIPEELIANIADAIMGGSGRDAYKGVLSELETNSILKLIEKIFKRVENRYKSDYNQELVFSATPQLLLKEMPEYQTISENSSFNFIVNSLLSLNDDQEFKIELLFDLAPLEGLMNDLGLSKTSAQKKKQSTSPLTVENLSGIQINITSELGRASVPVKYAMELTRGSLVKLDTQNNSDIIVFANGIEFAYAQLVVVEDNFGLKITRVISPEERLKRI